MLKILIADDEKVDCHQVERLLQDSKLECTCTAVSSILEAQLACKTSTFDCILIDYQLPGEDGLEGISFFHKQLPLIPIIMLTAYGNEMVAAQSFKNGASDYLAKKTLCPELLEASIIAAIEKKLHAKKAQESGKKIKHDAYHDSLTDAPNRFFFDRFLSNALAHAKRYKTMFAVLMVDLDSFKTVNDTLGHSAGDSVLKQVATRVQSVIRADDILARMGGDEFGIIVSEVNQMDGPAILAKKIIAVLQTPIVFNNTKWVITASLGIAIYPYSGETAADLLNSADKAMYQVKTNGKNNFRCYPPKLMNGS